MTRKMIMLVVLLGVVLLPFSATAQVKIGFVASERIRAEYEEFRDAESQLQVEFRKVQIEYQNMVAKLDSLSQDFETQRLMSSPEWRREKEKEITQLQQNIQIYQQQKVGPEGELYRKQTELESVILTRVKQAVDKVAIDKGYDYILDGSVSLLYGKPTHDVTDDVLHELRKIGAED